MFLQVKVQNGTNEIVGSSSVSVGATSGDIETGDVDVSVSGFHPSAMSNSILWWDGTMSNGTTIGVIKENFKPTKLNQIYEKTGQLLSGGTAWGGKTYLLPPSEREIFTARAASANNGADMTGKEVQSVDGSVYDFTSSVDFWSWFDAMLAHADGLLDGTGGQHDLIEQVQSAANTQVGMDAIVDARA